MKEKDLRKAVYEANMFLPENDLIVLTWGNASAVDREKGVVYIKPSGVAYEELTPENIVAVDLESGKSIGEGLKPSSDTPTHLALYRAFKDIGAIVHTHSPKATAWAQAGRDIPAFGTTHADYFYGPVPCTREMRGEEIKGDYEDNTAEVIVERFKDLNPSEIKGVLVHSHGPFVWGDTPHEAAENALVLETLASMAIDTELLGNREGISDNLLDVHFLRKHGPDAYYGQNNGEKDEF